MTKRYPVSVGVLSRGCTFRTDVFHLSFQRLSRCSHWRPETDGCLSTNFLKTGAIAGAVGFTVFGFDAQPLLAQADSLKISRTTETRALCPYCSVACGVIIHTLGDKAKNVTPQVVHVEGDPDHPINRGTLCPKGSSLKQDILNDRRILNPKCAGPDRTTGKTSPGIRHTTKSAVMDQEDTRRGFMRPIRQGQFVNRCESIAFTGGCTDTNEFNYLVVKAMRSLGVCTWKIRPGFDTDQRSQVRDPLSEEGP